MIHLIKTGYYQQAKNFLRNGLVLYSDAGNTNSYPGTGDDWYDISDNGNNAKLNNCSYSSDNGGSIVFNGSSGYANISNNLSNLTTTPATISCWIKASYANGNQIVFGNYTTKIGLGLYYSGGVKYFIVKVGSGSDAKPTFNVNSEFVNDTFNHVVVTYDESTNSNLWLNNVQITTTGSNNYWTWTVDETNIGKRSTGTYLKGNVYNIQVYNRILSEIEISQNYNIDKSRFGL